MKLHGKTSQMNGRVKSLGKGGKTGNVAYPIGSVPSDASILTPPYLRARTETGPMAIAPFHPIRFLDQSLLPQAVDQAGNFLAYSVDQSVGVFKRNEFLSMGDKKDSPVAEPAGAGTLPPSHKHAGR